MAKAELDPIVAKAEKMALKTYNPGYQLSEIRQKIMKLVQHH